MILKNNEISKYTSKEFSYFRKDPDTYKSLRIHNKLLNKLKNHYFCDEFVEHFYDYYENEDGSLASTEDRLNFCNWSEPYFEGNWGMSQKFVDNWAIRQLKQCRKWTVDKSHRFYIKDEGNIIEIFAFGRDEYGVDYWWVYKKIGEGKNTGFPVNM